MAAGVYPDRRRRAARTLLARDGSNEAMPIHEYACPACDKTFEALVLRKSDEAEVACPTCGTAEVSRVLSRPAATPRSGGGGGPSPACGPVG